VATVHVVDLLLILGEDFLSLWFPLYINDQQIGYVDIHRKESLKSPRDIHTYEWFAEFRRLKADGFPAKKVSTANGEVTHRYDRGWAALIAAVMAQLYTGYLPRPRVTTPEDRVRRPVADHEDGNGS
jgi:hypothetical protein